MIPAALAIVDGVDAALSAGLARLLPAQKAALGELAGSLAHSPLGGAVAAAARALEAGDPSPHHLVALAAGRCALMGAVHDALLAEAGLPLSPAVERPAPAIPAEQRARLDGLQQWLAEVALAGFSQLDVGMLAPVLPTVTTIQGLPGLARLAAGLTGFVHELLDHAPTSALPTVPARRWADLWSRALLGTVTLPEEPVSTPTSGLLQVLGADVRHHDHLVSVVIHGVLEAEGQRRFVRCPFHGWKVDAIAGAAAWNVVRHQSPELFKALATPAALSVAGLLSGTGAFTVEKVASSSAFDPFAVDLSGVAYCPGAPRDRHPLQIAIPARDAGEVDLSWSSPMLDFSANLKGAKSIIGLRRWDDGWRFSPVALRNGKGAFVGAADVLAAAEKAGDANAILQDKAKKLLREKS
ncbi:MAG TPA: hypothetical protein PKY30_11620 [Myxococcota bacterium]|nr:hypothetical protein [Myxococcota bacterium]